MSTVAQVTLTYVKPSWNSNMIDGVLVRVEGPQTKNILFAVYEGDLVKVSKGADGIQDNVSEAEVNQHLGKVGELYLLRTGKELPKQVTWVGCDK